MAGTVMTQTLHFVVDPRPDGDGFIIDVKAAGQCRSYAVPTATQQDFSSFFLELSNDFGTRVPHVFADALQHPAASMHWRPLLTENVHPQILVGYGDPAVLKTNDGWWLVATSNDAPDAFPLLHSSDLEHWEPRSFVFPCGQEPAWAARGRNIADYWAPEMGKAGGEYWTVFTARQADKALAIGLARAPSPTGPWTDNGAPLITGKPVDTTRLGYDASHPPMSGGVIDSHLFIDRDGGKYLFWKDDTNSIWPRPLAMLLRGQPDLVGKLFASEADRPEKETSFL